MPPAMVLVTGATGFVGRSLIPVLRERGFLVRAVTRHAPAEPPGQVAQVGEIGPDTDWSGVLENVSSVVHLAGLAHARGLGGPTEAAAHNRINNLGTRRLVEAAARAGVRRFIYVSSIKVNGEETGATPFTEDSPACPQEAYARSKLAAEEGLFGIGARAGMEPVVLRPPLIHGPGVKANVLSLLRAVRSGVPLPLGLVRNRRSLLAVGNLVDLIAVCLVHEAAAGELFLVDDGGEYSSADLVRAMARHMGRRPRLFPVPVAFLAAAGAICGARAVVRSLCGSLLVNGAKARSLLGWHPPVAPDEALADTVRHFLRTEYGTVHTGVEPHG